MSYQLTDFKIHAYGYWHLEDKKMILVLPPSNTITSNLVFKIVGRLPPHPFHKYGLGNVFPEQN